jgi:hypothetical protein
VIVIVIVIVIAIVIVGLSGWKGPSVPVLTCIFAKFVLISITFAIVPLIKHRYVRVRAIEDAGRPVSSDAGFRFKS